MPSTSPTAHHELPCVCVCVFVCVCVCVCVCVYTHVSICSIILQPSDRALRPSSFVRPSTSSSPVDSGGSLGDGCESTVSVKVPSSGCQQITVSTNSCLSLYQTPLSRQALNSRRTISENTLPQVVWEGHIKQDRS